MHHTHNLVETMKMVAKHEEMISQKCGMMMKCARHNNDPGLN